MPHFEVTRWGRGYGIFSLSFLEEVNFGDIA